MRIMTSPCPIGEIWTAAFDWILIHLEGIMNVHPNKDAREVHEDFELQRSGPDRTADRGLVSP